MNLLITGGCGYVGTVLVESLLKDDHYITVIDTQWFGNFLKESKKLKIVNKNILNLDEFSFEGYDSIIHLANIANDPSVDLDQTLSWEVNALAAQQIADKAVREGVNQIIYASSGSVYGVKEEEHVTEELSLVPISAYNKTKMVAERVFLSYQDKIKIHCIRPATVCGYSPRMRLDLSVNMLTMQALMNRKITVFGGNQTRPNINIHDMVRVYKHFLLKNNIDSGTYNAGFENISILDIAKKVSEKVKSEIIISESNDPRSYRQNSDKLIASGFVQKFTVTDAINEMIEKFQSNELEDKEEYYSIKTMKKILSAEYKS
tara:strand:- start:252 stop:1205 length:954 start_codon:yes stop_codon:yes gene_type:complete